MDCALWTNLLKVRKKYSKTVTRTENGKKGRHCRYNGTTKFTPGSLKGLGIGEATPPGTPKGLRI